MRDAASADSDVVVFAGPTLARVTEAAAWRDRLARVEVRAPARRGDVLRSVADGARTIVLLDGYYYTVPSVTHKEILHAIKCGVRVVGAASLGALRAAELEAFGMVGAGRVFRCFRDGVLDGDDEVALLHGPAELGYPPLTVALVEVRHALDRLVEDGVVERGDADRVVTSLKALGFVERTPDRVRSCADRYLDPRGSRALLAALRRPGIKERDALAALELVTRTGPGALAPDAAARRPTPHTGFLHYFKELAVGPAPHGGDRPTRLSDAWALTQMLHPGTPAFVRRVRVRYLLYSAGRHAGLEAAGDRTAEAADRLRRKHDDRFGGTLLPPEDYREEARIDVLARTACRELGGRDGALAWLARTLRIDPMTPAESLLALVRGQPDALPQWWMVRSFSFEVALEPALALVPDAIEIRACLSAWSNGGTIALASLQEVASQLWGCPAEELPAASADRALFAAPGASDGWRYAVELVAAAERLPEPINDYPQKRAALRSAPLHGPAGPG